MRPVRFQTFNRYIKRWIAEGLLVGSIFNLFGCSDITSSIAPAEAARRALNEKYNSEFTIISLSRKDGAGPFVATEYSGMAYENTQPMLPFSIWVSTDNELLYDSYHCVEMVSLFDEWATRKADGIWKGSKVHAKVRLLRRSGNLEYSNAEKFFSNEYADTTLTVCIPESMDLTNMEADVKDFFVSLGTGITGTANFYIMDCESLTDEELYEISENYKCQWSIDIVADDEFISRYFR